MRSWSTTILAGLGAAFVQASPTASNTVVSIPYEYTYLLPNGYTGNTNYTFVNGTHTSDDMINSLLAKAKNAPFICSYTDG